MDAAGRRKPARMMEWRLAHKVGRETRGFGGLVRCQGGASANCYTTQALS